MQTNQIIDVFLSSVFGNHGYYRHLIADELIGRTPSRVDLTEVVRDIKMRGENTEMACVEPLSDEISDTLIAYLNSIADYTKGQRLGREDENIILGFAPNKREDRAVFRELVETGFERTVHGFLEESESIFEEVRRPDSRYNMTHIGSINGLKDHVEQYIGRQGIYFEGATARDLVRRLHALSTTKAIASLNMNVHMLEYGNMHSPIACIQKIKSKENGIPQKVARYMVKLLVEYKELREQMARATIPTSEGLGGYAYITEVKKQAAGKFGGQGKRWEFRRWDRNEMFNRFDIEKDRPRVIWDYDAEKYRVLTNAVVITDIYAMMMLQHHTSTPMSLDFLYDQRGYSNFRIVGEDIQQDYGDAVIPRKIAKLIEPSSGKIIDFHVGSFIEWVLADFLSEGSHVHYSIRRHEQHKRDRDTGGIYTLIADSVRDLISSCIVTPIRPSHSTAWELERKGDHESVFKKTNGLYYGLLDYFNLKIDTIRQIKEPSTHRRVRDEFFKNLGKRYQTRIEDKDKVRDTIVDLIGLYRQAFKYQIKRGISGTYEDIAENPDERYAEDLETSGYSATGNFALRDDIMVMCARSKTVMMIGDTIYDSFNVVERDQYDEDKATIEKIVAQIEDLSKHAYRLASTYVKIFDENPRYDKIANELVEEWKHLRKERDATDMLLIKEYLFDEMIRLNERYLTKVLTRSLGRPKDMEEGKLAKTMRLFFHGAETEYAQETLARYINVETNLDF